MDTHLLKVNHVDIPPCSCGTGGEHWSVIDIHKAIGRTLAEADVIEVWIRTDGPAKDFKGE